MSKKMVCGFAFDEQDALYLINKKAYWWEGTRSNGFGGGIKPSEGIRTAMVRHMAEEGPVRTEEKDWSIFHHERYRNGNEVYYLVGRVSTPVGGPIVRLKKHVWESMPPFSWEVEAHGLTYLVPMAWAMLNRSIEMRPL